MKYRLILPKQQEVEAERFEVSNDLKDRWLANVTTGTGTTSVRFVGNVYQLQRDETGFHLMIPGQNGDVRANDGDYIVRDNLGNIYPMLPDLFERTYESVWKDRFGVEQAFDIE